MGEQTMFDLNEQIEEWRTSLLEKQTLGKSDIDELETHLREEIEQLTVAKLSEEESFCVAAHRLGDTSALAGEFEKVNTSTIYRTRFFWCGVGILAWLFAINIGNAASGICLFVAAANDLRGYELNIVGALSQMTFCLGTLFVLYQIIKRDVRNSHADIFSRMVDRPWGKLRLFAFVLVITVIIFGAKTLDTVGTARFLSIDHFSKVAMFRYIMLLVLIIATPLALLAGLFIVRLKKASQEANTA
jgi:hypothetical protein